MTQYLILEVLVKMRFSGHHEATQCQTDHGSISIFVLLAKLVMGSCCIKM